MIHGLWQICREDTSILIQWARGADLGIADNDERDYRIQMAAFRMIAAVAMAFGTLWAMQIITFVLMLPVKIVLKLALAIGCYALAHDVFVMCQNANQPDFQPDVKTRLWNLFWGHEVTEEERASKFTHGTFFQPVWMWMYVNREKIKVD